MAREKDMKHTFTRSYLATKAPSFAQFIDGLPETTCKFGSSTEKSMLIFLKEHGFNMKELEEYGYGVSLDDFGNVTIESWK